MMKMNSKQLECFICVADRMNFTKAAEELFLSTPTVTHHIKTLEDELGKKLFIRNSKSVKFTEEGKIFYGDAKDILNKFDMAQKKLNKVIKEDASFIKIGCTSYAELENIENILSSMKKKYPRVYPQIFVRDYRELKAMFLDRHIDVMLVTKDMIKDIECMFKKVKNMGVYAVMSPGIELPQNEKLKLEDIKYPIITLNPRLIPFIQKNRFKEKVESYIQNNFNIVCDNDRSSIMLAKVGYGIAILPENTIPAIHQGLIIKEVDDDVEIEYGIAYHQDYKEDYIRFFINYFNII